MLTAMQGGDGLEGLTHRWGFRQAFDARLAGGPRPLPERILAARGLVEPRVCDAFLAPALTQLHDPSLMPDMDRAASRIVEALRAGEPVAIYGDYDVDGVTGTAMLVRTMRAIAPKADVRTFIPHRDEGYGLSVQGVTELAKAGVKVIVSVDCGCTAFEAAAAARELGVDLIVTDHHNLPEGDLPDAWAVVHPGRDGAYPFADLSGAGVAFKLAWRLATLHAGTDRVGTDMRSLLVELVAMAALGTIADVVPLLGENRVLAAIGLSRMPTSSFAGIRALVRVSGLSDRVDAWDVGFRLGPRINACGRMGHANEALRLLLTDDDGEARSIAESLDTQNTQRRQLETRIVAQACEMAAGGSGGSIILAHEDWPRGLLGLAAARVAERFGRPAVLLRIENGVAHGSARSINRFNLHEALCACAEHLVTFGGHDVAAGLSLETSRLDAFRSAIDAHIGDNWDGEDFVESLELDADAAPLELTTPCVEAIERMAPFGSCNPAPVVRVRNVRVAYTPTAFGRDSAHLKVTFADAHGASMRAIAWRWAVHAGEFTPGRTMDVAIVPRLSRWNGTVRVEPELIDIRAG